MDETSAVLIDRLYAEHGALLLGYVTRQLGGDRARAEDIVQETLLRAWRHADRLDAVNGSIRGWLMRVAYNLVIDARRAAGARPAEVGDEPMRTIGVDTTEDMLNTLAIAAALRRLGPDQRSVITQLYLRGLTAPETARELGIPVGTVKSRAFHGLRKLRRALDDREEAAARIGAGR